MPEAIKVLVFGNSGSDKSTYAHALSAKDAFPPGLSQPALRALAGAGYTHLSQLSQISEADLRKLHGMGPKAIDIIQTEMKKNGQSFR